MGVRTEPWGTPQLEDVFKMYAPLSMCNFVLYFPLMLFYLENCAPTLCLLAVFIYFFPVLLPGVWVHPPPGLNYCCWVYLSFFSFLIFFFFTRRVGRSRSDGLRPKLSSTGSSPRPATCGATGSSCGKSCRMERGPTGTWPIKMCVTELIYGHCGAHSRKHI